MGCSKQAYNYKWNEKTDHMKNNDPFSIHCEQEPSRAKSPEKTDLVQLQYQNDP